MLLRNNKPVYFGAVGIQQSFMKKQMPAQV